MRKGLCGTVLLLALAVTASARSPFVAELDTLATRYHENPARLDVVKDGLAQATPQEPDPESWIALARACFIWGDVRATTDEEKLAAYSQGREAGRRAIELAPRNALAHLFYGINTGRWGQTRGVLRSLFLLSELRETIRQTLDLDPTLAAAYALAGNVDYEVPAMFGGSLERAEGYFRRGLGLDPHFTALRLGLGKVLRKQGRVAEAQQELRAVLDEAAPTNPAEWSTRDAPQARTLLSGPRP
ncbi:MAG TPA: tetratricopeptide repeat protein [Methylomirabilota bacterium]|nr:tetratricopeptide repeat protein [Methylomirabilota bacterium]